RRSVWLACGLRAVSTVAITLAGPVVTGQAVRIHFPGARLSGAVCEGWRQRYGGRLPLVAGDWLPAALVSFYAPGRPLVYADCNPVESPWCSDQELNARGGVLVWDCEERRSDLLPAPWQARFPRARPAGVLVLPKQTAARVPPARIGVAYLSPGR
ncbi:MAG: hypothetical protein HYU66_14440, partial [Armatimonadetes bacterium]|nr:hypothetical protein [Armatimonadota bacterium]